MPAKRVELPAGRDARPTDSPVDVTEPRLTSFLFSLLPTAKSDGPCWSDVRHKRQSDFAVYDALTYNGWFRFHYEIVTYAQSTNREVFSGVLRIWPYAKHSL